MTAEGPDLSAYAEWRVKYPESDRPFSASVFTAMSASSSTVTTRTRAGFDSGVTMPSEREAVIQKAIEEWQSVEGGPGGRPGEPTLAHYIDTALREHRPFNPFALEDACDADD